MDAVVQNGIALNPKSLLQKVDSTPTTDSENPVASGGVKTYVDQKDSTTNARVDTLGTQIAANFFFKGSSTYAALPSSGNTINDTYYVTDSDKECWYSWNGTDWIKSSMSQSDYAGLIAQLKADVSSEFSTAKTYNIGDYCLYGSDAKLYVCKTAITTTGAAWDSTKWQVVSFGDALSDIIIADDTQPTSVANKIWLDTDPAIETVEVITEEDLGNLIIAEFDSTSSYAVGDYALHNAKLYKAKTASAANDGWIANRWTQVTVMGTLNEEVGNLKTQLTQTNSLKVPFPVYPNSKYGTDGQVLRTNGSGETEWASVGQPTPEETDRAISAWLTAHPEATTTVQDGSLTEAKFSNALKLESIKDYVTPEMYGAVGDGTTDDTTAFQNAVDACCLNNGVLMLVPGKNYKLTSTINISARMVLIGSGAKITSAASWAIHVHSNVVWDGEYTVLRDLYLVCVNGIKIGSIRTLLISSMIRNTGTAIITSPTYINEQEQTVKELSYESIITDCYLVNTTSGQNAVGIECNSPDIIFDKITGYGQKTFIKNYGTSSTFSNIHAWPIDAEYTGSVFFYEVSNGFSANIFSCHSDTYQYAFRSAGRMNHKGALIKNCICSWANKPEGWLYYGDTYEQGNWDFMRYDGILNSLPETFHVSNIAGNFCFDNYKFKLNKNLITVGENCYCDNAVISTDGDTLNMFIYGSVNTARRTDLELYIPYCKYFGNQNIWVKVGDSMKNGQIIPGGDNNGLMKVQCTEFTADSGYVLYRIITSVKMQPSGYFENDSQP